jgi:hypothetical protein
MEPQGIYVNGKWISAAEVIARGESIEQLDQRLRILEARRSLTNEQYRAVLQKEGRL